MPEKLTVFNMAGTYGGTRLWFNYPRCTRRVAVLYMRRGYFACRHCQKVAYSSQSDDALDRMWRKQSKIEARLGEHWRRPKGMRRRTYDRLWGELMACEERRELALEQFVARFVGLI